MAEHLVSAGSAGQRPLDVRQSLPGPAVSSLPAALSSFVGREVEVPELRGVLEGSRLVTLSGAPGIGKTRLALEVAGGCAGSDGALVELDRIADPALVPRAVAAVLRVQEVPGVSLVEALVARLRRAPVLLVLDNCEHLLGACAEVVDTLLSGCPDLRVLATSREPLGIAGERVWQVPALSVPARDVEPSSEALLGYGAVALFVERARAVAPGWALIDEVSGPVAEITRRLDGIPLALELAATRVQTLTAAEIARRLDDRFALLTKGSRSDLPRHQTLQAAVDWSHELLSPSERAVLRRLSVFVGGFCLEAAQEVCAGGDVEPSEVFDLLSGLVLKSLVVANTANSRGRYRMLETIRAYAADRLEEAEESAALGEAHARFYLAFAEDAEPRLTGPEQERWFERLDAEHENLRFALHWSLGHGHTEWALRLAGALILFWRVRCHFSEGRQLLEATITASDREQGAATLRATALWGAGFLRQMGGDPVGARGPLEESLAAFRELDNPRGCARALLILGTCGPYAWDVSMLEESVELARRAGDLWCLAHALTAAGGAHDGANDLNGARPLIEAGVAVAREADDKQGLRYGLEGLSNLAVQQGDYRNAEVLLHEVLHLVRELGEDLFVAEALGSLADVAIGRGDYERAGKLLKEEQAVCPEYAPYGTVLIHLVRLGTVAHAQRDQPRARLHFEEARACARPYGTSDLVLQGMGRLAAEEGDLTAARQLFEACGEGAKPDGHKGSRAHALHGLAEVARGEGDCKRATTLHNQALELRRQVGHAPEITDSLEAVGGLIAASGRHQHGARLLGAAHALRESRGYARRPWDHSRYDADLSLVRQHLSSEELEVAWAQGSKFSIEEAITQASKGRRVGSRPGNGWESLTETELRVAGLVADGLNNPEIAKRLVVTPETVKTHVSNIFSKLGVTSRTELARDVGRRGERASPTDSDPCAPPMR